jgi:hypothetical protein
LNIFSNFSIEISLDGRYSFYINPVRNSSGALNPALRGGTPYGAEPGIIPKM